jgi:hypothetical protein
MEEFIKIDRTLQKEMIRILEQGGINVQGRTHAEKLTSLTVQGDRASRGPPPPATPQQARFQQTSSVQLSIGQQARFARASPEHLHPEHARYGTQYRPSGSGQSQLGARSVHEFHTYPAPLRATTEYPARLATPAPVQNFLPTRPIDSVHIEPVKLIRTEQRERASYVGRKAAIHTGKNNRETITPSFFFFFKIAKDRCRTIRRTKKESRVIWGRQFRTLQKKRFSIVRQIKTGEG